MNGYDLSRNFFEFSFENPDRITPNHVAVFFFAIDLCNRLGWKEKFGFPTSTAMEAVGIKSYNTYKKTFDDLVDIGAFKVLQYSKNQYSSNIIALSNFDKAHNKALTKHLIKQHQSISESISESISSIDKQETTNKEQSGDSFLSFWEMYGKKKDKDKSEKKWLSLSEKDRQLAIGALPSYKKSTPEVTFRKNPLTWLNGKCWLDEIDLHKNGYAPQKEVQPLPNNSSWT